jgi:hypothetical protein
VPTLGLARVSAGLVDPIGPTWKRAARRDQFSEIAGKGLIRVRQFHRLLCVEVLLKINKYCSDLVRISEFGNRVFHRVILQFD